MNLCLAKCRIDEQVTNRNQDDQGERIQIGEYIVGKAVQLHDCSLRSQVVVKLIVSEPVNWVPTEDRASSESTANFINPLVVKCHPARSTAWLNGGWLDSFPESSIVKILVGSDRVERPAALVTKKEETDSFAENGARRRGAYVSVAAPNQDGWAEAQQDCWEQESEPEANVLFAVNHTDLSN
jgi:hypothetical protein